MFEIFVEGSFSAGHALRGYKGKCENQHGHNYKVRLTLEGATLDRTGLLCDFVVLKQSMREVMAALDHKYLNDQAPFDLVNPSAENLAKYFYDEAVRSFPPGDDRPRLASVTVWETDLTAATYRPDGRAGAGEPSR
ncbi:MAG TPA: 6-carboxytetrahydropterin synthase QueD [Candidatus Acidoferrales bacterium]|nr:6-carboxytetrahydropterin synthase QueD [Candidatus Acidoferrales bacterium]